MQPTSLSPPTIGLITAIDKSKKQRSCPFGQLPFLILLLVRQAKPEAKFIVEFDGCLSILKGHDGNHNSGFA